MFNIDLSIAGNKKGSIKLPAFTRKMIPNLIRGIDKGTHLLESYIKAKQLSGQALNVRTGRLRSSFHAIPAREGSTGNVYGVMGTNVKYAAVHEYGFSGQVDVAAFNRKTGPVRAHTRHMRIRPKLYAEKTMTKNQPAVQGYIVREVMKPLL